MPKEVPYRLAQLLEKPGWKWGGELDDMSQWLKEHWVMYFISIAQKKALRYHYLSSVEREDIASEATAKFIEHIKSHLFKYDASRADDNKPATERLQIHLDFCITGRVSDAAKRNHNYRRVREAARQATKRFEEAVQRIKAKLSVVLSSKQEESINSTSEVPSPKQADATGSSKSSIREVPLVDGQENLLTDDKESLEDAVIRQVELLTYSPILDACLEQLKTRHLDLYLLVYKHIYEEQTQKDAAASIVASGIKTSVHKNASQSFDRTMTKLWECLKTKGFPLEPVIEVHEATILDNLEAVLRTHPDFTLLVPVPMADLGEADQDKFAKEDRVKFRSDLKMTLQSLQPISLSLINAIYGDTDFGSDEALSKAARRRGLDLDKARSMHQTALTSIRTSIEVRVATILDNLEAVLRTHPDFTLLVPVPMADLGEADQDKFAKEDRVKFRSDLKMTLQSLQPISLSLINAIYGDTDFGSDEALSKAARRRGLDLDKARSMHQTALTSIRREVETMRNHPESAVEIQLEEE